MKECDLNGALRKPLLDIVIVSTNHYVKIYNAGESSDHDDQDFHNDDPFNGKEERGDFLHRGNQGDRDKPSVRPSVHNAFFFQMRENAYFRLL